MTSGILPKARKDYLVIQELREEVLIYDLNTNKAFCLNEPSAKIWRLCDGNNDVSQISKQLGKHFNSSVGDDFVWLALDQLKNADLIENKEDIAINFKGMSRRDVIRRLGLASFIALPFISFLVAPPAAQAQSSICRTISCSNSAFCQGLGCGNCNPRSGTCRG